MNFRTICHSFDTERIEPTFNEYGVIFFPPNTIATNMMLSLRLWTKKTLKIAMSRIKKFLIFYANSFCTFCDSSHTRERWFTSLSFFACNDLLLFYLFQMSLVCLRQNVVHFASVILFFFCTLFHQIASKMKRFCICLISFIQTRLVEDSICLGNVSNA